MKILNMILGKKNANYIDSLKPIIEEGMKISEPTKAMAYIIYHDAKMRRLTSYTSRLQPALFTLALGDNRKRLGNPDTKEVMAKLPEIYLEDNMEDILLSARNALAELKF